MLIKVCLLKWKPCANIMMKLTNKVANLKAVSTTPTKASKKKNSIFNMSKKDASTSCNDLCLDSSLCNQVCVEKIVVDTSHKRLQWRMSNSSKKWLASPRT